MGYTTPDTAVPGAVLPSGNWNLKIRDSIEHVAKPPRCRVNRSASQAVGHAAISDVVWQNEEYDSANIWTPAAPSNLVIPEAGWYHVIFNAQFSPNGAGGRHLAILYNGGGIATFNAGPNATWYVGGSVSAHYYMAAGGIVKAMAYQSSGAALNLDIAYNINFQICMISR